MKRLYVGVKCIHTIKNMEHIFTGSCFCVSIWSKVIYVYSNGMLLCMLNLVTNQKIKSSTRCKCTKLSVSWVWKLKMWYKTQRHCLVARRDMVFRNYAGIFNLKTEKILSPKNMKDVFISNISSLSHCFWK